MKCPLSRAPRMSQDDLPSVDAKNSLQPLSKEAAHRNRCPIQSRLLERESGRTAKSAHLPAKSVTMKVTSDCVSIRMARA